MGKSDRNAAIAAAIILGGFGLAAFYMPTIMRAVGKVSTVAAGAIAVLFVAAFFLVFWLHVSPWNLSLCLSGCFFYRIVSALALWRGLPKLRGVECRA